jgi:UDP-glucuronate decarboxylase
MSGASLISIHRDAERSEQARTIVITGGAGFLGSHLCDRHIDRGDRVICLDDLSSGRLANITHLMDNPAFEFRRHDVLVPFTVDGRVDVIYNLACPASPPKYQRDPIRTFKTSILGAEHALQLAVEKQAIVLQASTSEVYGDPDISPQVESYNGNTNTFGPRACYDEGKRAAETLFHDYRERRGARIRVARIFNTYGPRMDPEDGRVMANFICQALRGEALTLYGDGSQTRSFCFVDDLVRGLLALTDAPDHIDMPVNLANPEELTIHDLAVKLQARIGSASTLVFRDLPTDDPRRRCPDIARARRLLNWSPRVALTEGLTRTIPYFAEHLADVRKAGTT